MKVNVKSIANAGDPVRERLVLRVTASTDIGEYLVLRTTGTDGTVTTRVKNVFWFPDHPVNSGDLIVLYTKKGIPSKKKLENDTTAHFFYLRLDKCIWTDQDAAVVLMHVDDWDSFFVQKDE